MTRPLIYATFLLLLTSAICSPFGKLNPGISFMKSLPRLSADFRSITNRIADEVVKNSHIAESIFNRITRDTESKVEEMANNIRKQSDIVRESIVENARKAFEKNKDVFDRVNGLFKLFSEVAKHQESSVKTILVKNEDEKEQKSEEIKTSETNVGEEVKEDEPTKKTTNGENKEITKKSTDPITDNSKEEKKDIVITSELVQEINKRRGVGVVGDDYHILIAKLANPKTRGDLIRGFFKKSTSDMKNCQHVYDEIANLVPIVVQLMTANSNQDSIMLALNSKVKMDTVMQRLDENSPFLQCFNVEETNLKLFILKLSLDSGTFIDKCKENEKVWLHLGKAMASFQLGAAEVAGTSLAQASKAGSEIQVTTSDEVLHRVNFWNCANTILKTKRSQPVTSNMVNDWHRAAGDSTTICLNTASN